MNTLNYEFRIADQHFTEIVKVVRERGGEVTDKVIDLEGLRAGYHYEGNRLKMHFEDKALDNHRYPKETPLLDIVNEVKAKGIPAVWPPATVEPEPVEEAAEEVEVGDPKSDLQGTEDAEPEPPVPSQDEKFLAS